MSEHTKEEAEQIAVHVEMLLDDEMRAHAYADAEAHDLPFQVFRVLTGYREALDQRGQLLAALQMALADHMTEAYLHPLRDGTVEAIRCAIASAEEPPCA